MRASVTSLGLAALIASLGIAEELPELRPLPEPALAQVDPAVGRQLREARSKVETMLRQTGAGSEDLATAYGGLGRLYLLYGLDSEAEICLHNAGVLAPEDYRWPYYQAVIFQESGRPAAARVALARTLELRPGDPAATLRAAQVNLELGDLAPAAVLFERAVENVGTAAAARYGLGQIALLEGRHEAAIDHYRAVLAAQPEATSAHYQLGLVYRELGDRVKAAEQLAHHGLRPVSFDDPLMQSLRSGSTGAALHVVDGALARSRGDYVAAIAAFRRALAANPDDLSVKLSLAASLSEAGSADEALAVFGEILEKDAANPAAHYYVGTLMAQRGDLDTAIEHLIETVQGAPDFLSAHLSLAAILAQLQRFTEAEDHYRIALTLDPGNHHARTQRAAVLVQLGQRERAEAELRRVLAAEPDNSRAWFALAQILEASGRADAAYAALEQAAVHTRETAEAVQLRSMLARRAGRTGDYSKAAEQFAEVLRLAPYDEGARFGRALALLFAERYREASAHLEESVAVMPQSVGLKHMLARLLATCPDAELRDGSRALALAQQVLEEEQRLEHAETLAMAWAETGEFDRAVEIQQRIIEQVSRGGPTAALPGLERRLALYQQRQPCRAPWLDDGP